jgi:hypothetical protein
MTRKPPYTKCLKNQGMIAADWLTVAGEKNKVREIDLPRKCAVVSSTPHFT